MTLFQRIIAREIPAEIVYETADILAFRDIHPQAPTHILVIPKKPIPKLSDAVDGDGDLLGKVLLAARDVARQEGLENFRLVVNNGAAAGQSVFHLHVHIMGGRSMVWPPG